MRVNEEKKNLNDYYLYENMREDEQEEQTTNQESTLTQKMVINEVHRVFTPPRQLKLVFHWCYGWMDSRRRGG